MIQLCPCLAAIIKAVLPCKVANVRCQLVSSRQTCPGIALAVFAFLHVANGEIVLVVTSHMNKRQDSNDLIQPGCS